MFQRGPTLILTAGSQLLRPVPRMALATHNSPAGLDFSDALVSIGRTYYFNQREINKSSQTPK